MTFEFAHFHKITKIIPLDSELNLHFGKIQGNLHKILGGFDLSEKREKINFFKKSEKKHTKPWN